MVPAKTLRRKLQKKAKHRRWANCSKCGGRAYSELYRGYRREVGPDRVQKRCTEPACGYVDYLFWPSNEIQFPQPKPPVDLDGLCFRSLADEKTPILVRPITDLIKPGGKEAAVTVEHTDPPMEGVMRTTTWPPAEEDLANLLPPSSEEAEGTV